MKNCLNHGFAQIHGLHGFKSVLSVSSEKSLHGRQTGVMQTEKDSNYPKITDVLDFNSIEFEGISLDTKVVEFDHFELLTIDKKEEQKISDICAILQIRDADKKEKHLIISNKSVILTT